MKNAVIAFLVMALAASTLADVAVTAADLGAGHIRITISPSGGAAVRGVALVLERTAGDAIVASTSAVIATGLNTFIDYALTAGTGYTAIGQGHPAAKWNQPGGEATFPADSAKFSLCAGYLDENGVDPKGEGLTVDSFFDVFYTAGSASISTIAISLDTLRGGIVGDNLGTITVQSPFQICPCSTLIISSTAGGNVIDPGEGVFCLTGCVPITVSADPGYVFVNWSGDTANIVNVNAANTMICLYDCGDYTIHANFVPIPETITTPTVVKTTATPAIATRVNSGRVETFVASGAVSSQGHALEYNFTWGDGTTSGWGPATRTKAFTYSAATTYNVTVQARCSVDTGITSASSAAIAVTTEEFSSSIDTLAYTAWSLFGRKKCWAYPRNCRGDTDGRKIGLYFITSCDLNVFKASYTKADSLLQTICYDCDGTGPLPCVPGICADSNKAKVGLYRVTSADLTVLKSYYTKMDSAVPICPLGAGDGKGIIYYTAP